MDCSVCQGEMTAGQQIYDDRYGYPGYFALGTCPDCGHTALRAQLDEEQLGALYTTYYPRSTFEIDSYAPAPRVSGFLAWLNGAKCSAYCWVPAGVTILDIGCGFGEALGYHRSRGCEVYGVEADQNTTRIAARHGFKIHLGLFDPKLYPPDFFDYVTLDQVIEHVSDPLQTLTGVASVLKPGGVAIISTPNPRGFGARVFGRRWINWHAPYHLQHFSVKSMAKAAAAAGLRLERTRNITSSEWLLYQWIHLATFPAQGSGSIFWSPHRRRGVAGNLLLALFNGIHLTGLDHLLTRLLDGLGLGDNNLFFLRKNDQ